MQSNKYRILYLSRKNLKTCVNAYSVIAFGGTTVEPVPDVPLSTAAMDGGAVNKMNSRDPSELILAAGAANSLGLAPTSSATAVSAVPNLGLLTTPKPSQLKNDCLHPFIFLFFFSFIDNFQILSSHFISLVHNPTLFPLFFKDFKTLSSK
jgi:hypothetical protein